MPSPDPLARTGRDGCQCTPYVRCVHFEGQRVWMVEGQGVLRAHPDFKGRVYAYHVFGPTNDFRLQDCCGYEHVNESARMFLTDSLPAALEEFERREALLLEPANA